MDPVLVSTLFGSMALVVLFAIIASIRRGSNFLQWDASTAFILLIALALVLPYGFTQFTGGLKSFVDATGALIVLPDARAGQISQAIVPLIIILGVAFFIQGIWVRRAFYWPPVLAILLVVVTDLSSALAGSGEPGSPRIWALISIFLAATVLPRGRGAQTGIAIFGLTVALASTVLIFANYSAAIRACRLDKCGPLGNLILGVANGENVLAILIAPCIPAAYLIFRGRTRWIVTAYLTAFVWLAGSRTAAAAALVVSVLILVTRVRQDSAPSMAQKVVVRLTFSVGVAVCAVLPFVPLDRGQFTGRADLWALARSQLIDSPVLGFGGLTWGNQVQIGIITRDQAYSVHNQFLDVLYTAGVTGLIIFVLMLVLAIALSKRGYRALSLLLLAPMVYVGILERSWAFGLLDVWAWMCAAMMLALPSPDPNGSFSAREGLIGQERVGTRAVPLR